MATLALGLAGAAIGAPFAGFLGLTGAQIGFSIGSALGGLLFAPDGPDVQGPRLDSLNVTSSAYGAPISKVYGTARLGGNIIWAQPIQETAHTESYGGKGGPSGSSTTYTYSATFAVGICEGEIKGIRRIWADSVLIYDFRDTADGDTIIQTLATSVTIYNGDETQQPDPTMESFEGSGEVPAYRGLAYAVFENLQLANYGNRIPNLTFEVVTGQQSYNIEVFDYLSYGTYYRYVTGPHYEDGEIKLYTRLPAYGPDPGPCTVIRVDPTTLTIIGTEELPAVPRISGAWYAHLFCGYLGGSRLPVHLVPHQNLYINNVLVTSNCTRYFITNDRQMLVVFDDPTNHLYFYDDTGTLTYTIATNPSVDINHMSGFTYDNTTGKMWVNWLSSMYLYDIDLVNETITRLLSFNNSSYYLGNLETYMIVVGGFCYCYGVDSAAHTYLEKLSDISLYPAETILLKDIIEDLCSIVGISSVDTTGIASKEVKGFIRDKPMSPKAAMQPLLEVFSVSAAEVDYSLQFDFKDGVPDKQVLSDYLSATEGTELPDPLKITRTQELELPKSLELKYLDIDGDYQIATQRAQRSGDEVITVGFKSFNVPIVLNADEAAQLAEKLLYRAWTEREQYDFFLPIKYSDLVSGDVVQIQEDGNVHIIRILSAAFALPGLLAMQGVSDRATLYTSSAAGGAISYLSSSLVYIANTILKILDLPALRSADLDTAGYYLAAYGEATSWNGATIYKSIDNGASWAPVTQKTIENKIGSTTDTLTSATPHRWDFDSAVTVEMKDGATLSSDTTDNLLADETINRAVVGNEIIAFADAALVGVNTYELSTLLRGQVGTEHEIDNHVAGDRFVLLDSNIARVGSTFNNLGKTILFKAVSNGQYLEDVDSISATFDNLNSKPWSVVHLRGTRDGSNNFTINWSRRSRATAQMLWTPVLQEDSEIYEVDVMDGSAVVRTLQVGSETASYSASQQTEDGFTPGDPITVRVYQISANVGRGYVREETI